MSQYLGQHGNLVGSFPATMGRTLWVSPSAAYTLNGSPYTATDGNSGETPKKALLSVSRAQELATADAGDVIALLPGTHTLAASLAASKAGVTYLGLPYLPVVGGHHGVASLRPQATLTTSAADEGINVTAADCTFVNLRFLPVTQQKALDYSVAADRLRVIACMVDLSVAVAHANTRGIFTAATTSAPSDVMFDRCVFKEANAGTTNGAGLTVGAAINFLVQNCLFIKHHRASTVAWTTAAVVNDNAYGVFAYNRFAALGGAAGNAITGGILGTTHTGAGAILCERNTFSVTVTSPITGWAAADVDLVLNYVASVAGGAGGALITSTT